ncbi:MAG: stage II sporulation protein M [Planctomycetota bacterium]
MALPEDETGPVARRPAPGEASSGTRCPFTGVNRPPLPTRRLWSLHRLLRLPPNAFAPEHRTIRLDQARSSWWIWLLLGLLAAAIGQIAAGYVFWRAQAWNGSLLFSLCMLAGYIFPAFQRHAKSVWSGHEAVWRANRALAVELGSLFLGLAAGFALGPMLLGEQAYYQVLPGSQELADPIARLDLAPLLEILVHNLRVYALFFLIGVVFRYMGILFAIIYNASQWGLVIGVSVVGQSIYQQDGGRLSGLLLVLCLLPHVLLEIVSYVLAAMAGVFISRLVGRYRLFSPRLNRVMLSIYKVLGLGLLVLILAALVESWIDQPLLRRLFSASGMGAYPANP